MNLVDARICKLHAREQNVQDRMCFGPFIISGVAQWLACWAHNPKVRGSKPRRLLPRLAHFHSSKGAERACVVSIHGPLGYEPQHANHCATPLMIKVPKHISSCTFVVLLGVYGYGRQPDSRIPQNFKVVFWTPILSHARCKYGS